MNIDYLQQNGVGYIIFMAKFLDKMWNNVLKNNLTNITFDLKYFYHYQLCQFINVPVRKNEFWVAFESIPRNMDYFWDRTNDIFDQDYNFDNQWNKSDYINDKYSFYKEYFYLHEKRYASCSRYQLKSINLPVNINANIYDCSYDWFRNSYFLNRKIKVKNIIYCVALDCYSKTDWDTEVCDLIKSLSVFDCLINCMSYCCFVFFMF